MYETIRQRFEYKYEITFMLVLWNNGVSFTLDYRFEIQKKLFRVLCDTAPITIP